MNYRTPITRTLAMVAVLFSFVACVLSGSETMVTISGNQWLINGRPILRDSAAEGLLINARMVNAVFEDRRGVGNLHQNYDPEENTNRFISGIPDYYAHGVRAFTISLQGGMPGYEGAVSSVFLADGTLRPQSSRGNECMGNGKVWAPIAVVSDFILTHFNRTPLSLFSERIMEARSYSKPVVCNEDDKIGIRCCQLDFT